MSGAPEKSRELLIEAGKKIFSSRGYDAATVKEICEEAGVNVSLISYYFKGKEGLFQACLEQYGQTRLQSAQRILQKPASSEEFKIRLKMFVDEMTGCFCDDPAVTRMIMREIELGLPTTREVFEGTFLKVFETLMDFMRSASEAGFLKPKIDPKMASSMLFGSLSSIARMDQVNQLVYKQTITNKNYREKVTDQFVQIFLEGTASSPENPA